MTRRLLAGFLVAAATAGFAACGDEPVAKPTEPTATVTTAPDATVDRFVGVWGPDPADGTPLDLDGPENTADVIDARRPCHLVQFHVEREPDSRAAKIVFAAVCANARIRGRGTGLMNDGVLHWRAQGVVALSSGRTCEFKFVEGNRAVRVAEGVLRVHYNGTVCDVPVSGTQIVKKHP